MNKENQPLVTNEVFEFKASYELPTILEESVEYA